MERYSALSERYKPTDGRISFYFSIVSMKVMLNLDHSALIMADLFKKDNDVDNLNLDDKWTTFFKSVGEYDFAHTINVDVLGHIFEKSINDIEKIRLTGLFESRRRSEATTSQNV